EKDSLDVATKHVVPECNRAIFAPSAVDTEFLSQNLGKNPLVHAEFWQREFQLIHVAVIADLFGPGHGFEASCGVVLDEGRRVGIPPMAVRDDVRENPGITGELLVRDASEH